MTDPAENTLFSNLHTPTARLIRCPEAPDPATLTAGDMVICGDDWGVDEFIDTCEAKGVHVRTGRYRYEDERVTMRRTRRAVTVDFAPVLDASKHTPPGHFFDPDYIQASTDAFGIAWDALSAPLETAPRYEPAEDHVPASWVKYLPFPTLNPAQVQAAAKIIQGGPLMVVAPTGAGKTVIGMLSALREIMENGGKAAWLVPQRTLTAELDRELDTWREQGLKVVALSGETAMDARATKEADLWVATTEKFEALCRASSMREAISQIGTLIVDEIHLLGEPQRGPMLETLLARIRGEGSPVRLVGLSATAANAGQVAEWLGADLLEIAWRPTRLTHQVLTLPSGDRSQEGRWRNAAAVEITREVTRDGGSTLVFCGAKANVRSAALAIATSRGVDTTDIDPGDIEAVADACDEAGVGLHYSDWPRKNAAEKKFRDREIDVLVATSTLAAGVNTPARAVVVRDTTIGPQTMEVSMVQQMFGRAGRAGKEPEGWAFLLTTADESARWRQRLATGYSIHSAILNGIADHLLGEIVQGNVRTLRQAEAWWSGTLAHFQGNHSMTALTEAKDFLTKWRFIEVEEAPQADQTITVTRLGALTSKMMVGVLDAARLIARLSKTNTPKGFMQAETALIQTIAAEVYALSNSQDAPHDQVIAVHKIIAAEGDVRALDTVTVPKGKKRATGEEVAVAGMLLAVRSPRVLNTRARQIAGVNRSLFNPALYDSPRYFAWLSALGPLGNIPAWAAVAAFDLGRRVTWHRLTPPRGSGRLLWLCEKVAEGRDPQKVVPDLYKAAVESNCTSPDNWPFTERPKGTRLSERDYQTLITTDTVTLRTSKGTVETTPGASVSALSRTPEGERWQRISLKKGKGEHRGGLAVAFTAKGDCRGTDWLDRFAFIHH